jgi:hypothetical protein
MWGPRGRWYSLALIAAIVAAAAAWADARSGWISPVFDAIAHQFYEVPLLCAIRRPSQLVLLRCHLAIGAVFLVLGLLLAPRLDCHGRRWLLILGAGYAIRAIIWICGGNLPLVPGDSCHGIEVATSVLRGEGPVKHYAESFFILYPRIQAGQNTLDDWAPPLDAYVRALAFRLAGLGPSASVESRFVVAKACSFVLNLLALPALYVFARRRYGCRVAIWAMATLAVLPVHAIYAGFVLRDSLVALLSILTIWTLTEVCHAAPGGRSIWAWALAAGLCGGLTLLARNTGLALLAAAGPVALWTSYRGRTAALLLCAAVAGAVALPWAIMTFQAYGSPFYSETNYFEYNFSWTVHHYDQGNTRPSQFYTLENLPEIVRVKLKSLLTIPVCSTMMLGLPVVLGFCSRLRTRHVRGRETDLLVATIFAVFVLATLKAVADVTQVAQLGRYYLPVFALMLPGAIAGVIAWCESLRLERGAIALLAAAYCAMVWSDPTWAYDASWLTKRYQLHWPALLEAGEWIRANPDRVSPDARIMTWFPWELRVTSDRTTILMPRNYSPRRIQEVIRQYGVTHFLWGSFEPPPYFEINPESWAHELDQLRTATGLRAAREVYRSTRAMFFPVRLYRLQ